MKNAIREKELGVLSVDAGDVVCFSLDSFIKIAEKLKRGFANKKLDVHAQSADLDEFIKENDGILCEFHCDGGYGVSKVTAVGPDGNTYSAALIGGPGGTKRLLAQGEEEFNEMLDRKFGKDQCPSGDSKEWKDAVEEHQAALRKGG